MMPLLCLGVPVALCLVFACGPWSIQVWFDMSWNDSHLHSCHSLFSFPPPIFYLSTPALKHYVSTRTISRLFYGLSALTWFINNQKRTFDRNRKIFLEAKFHWILNIYTYLKHLDIFLVYSVFTSCIRSWKVTSTCNCMTFALNCHLSQLICCETILPSAGVCLLFCLYFTSLLVSTRRSFIHVRDLQVTVSFRLQGSCTATTSVCWWFNWLMSTQDMDSSSSSMDGSSVPELWYRRLKPQGKVRRRVQDLRIPSSSYYDFIASRPTLDLSHNESNRLAADSLLSRGIEGYHEVLNAEGEVDFLSELEKIYILENGRDGSTGWKCLLVHILFSLQLVVFENIEQTSDWFIG